MNSIKMVEKAKGKILTHSLSILFGLSPCQLSIKLIIFEFERKNYDFKEHVSMQVAFFIYWKWQLQGLYLETGQQERTGE